MKEKSIFNNFGSNESSTKSIIPIRSSRHSKTLIMKPINMDFNKINPVKQKQSFSNFTNFTKSKINMTHLRSLKDVIRSKKSKFKKITSKKIITKDFVYNFLLKSPNLRGGRDVKLVAEYLSKHYQYFADLDKNDSQVIVEKIAKIARLERIPPKEAIISFGEIGNKCYIVMEGTVEVFKPEYKKEKLFPIDFFKILRHIKNTEKDLLKYQRIRVKNNNFPLDITQLDKIDPNIELMRKKQNFYIETEKKMGEYGEGFSFGEIAMLQKTVRNATIKSVDGTVLCAILNEDYNRAIKECQEKRLLKEIEKFVKTYPFFSCFNNDKILKIFNCMSKRYIDKDEYLFKQNEDDDSLYFICSGIFSISVNVSFSWLNEYFDYLNDFNNNILLHIYLKKPSKLSEMIEITDNIKMRKCKSPMKMEGYDLWEKKISEKYQQNFYGIKAEEEKLNESKKIFRLHLKNIDGNELIGLEDCFEFKKKLYSVQCISEKGEIKSLKIYDLLKIIYNFREKELKYLLNIILERKKILKAQIINDINYLEKKIISNFDLKYNNLMKENCIKKDNEFSLSKGDDEDQDNLIVTAIKMRGYKKSIQDILDENFYFLPVYRDKDKSNSKKTDTKMVTKLKKILKNKNFDTNIKYFKKKKQNFSKLFLDKNNQIKLKTKNYNNDISNNLYSNTFYGENRHISGDNTIIKKNSEKKINNSKIAKFPRPNSIEKNIFEMKLGFDKRNYNKAKSMNKLNDDSEKKYMTSNDLTKFLDTHNYDHSYKKTENNLKNEPNMFRHKNMFSHYLFENNLSNLSPINDIINLRDSMKSFINQRVDTTYYSNNILSPITKPNYNLFDNNILKSKKYFLGSGFAKKMNKKILSVKPQFFNINTSSNLLHKKK